MSTSTATATSEQFHPQSEYKYNKEEKYPRCLTSRTGMDNYVGQHKKAVRHGYGTYTYTNRYFRYEGEWVDGKKHGLGKLMMNDGSYYNGEFSNGEIEGNGTRYYRLNGNIYTGSFHRGELHGQGIMEYKDGSLYEGGWAFNKREGHGILTEKDGTTYDGGFHQHKKHGYGSINYVDGDHYIGDWIQDQRHGHGTYTTDDGTIYEGQWANNVISGMGSIKHSSGMTYEGQWINGLPQELATKLFFIPNDEILYIDNENPFSIKVQCHDDDDQPIPDQGRRIQIIAGIQPPTPPQNTSPQEVDDIDNKDNDLIETPFGFSILPCELNIPMEPPMMALDQMTNEDIEENENRMESGFMARQSISRPEDFDCFEPLPKEMTMQTTIEGEVVWENLLPPKSLFLELEKQNSVPQEVPKKQSKQAASEKKKAQKVPEKEEKMAEFVLIAKDITSPPFMAQRLQPAFLKIRIKKTKRK